MPVRIDPGGVEYIHIPTTGVPFDAGSPEWCFDPADTSPLERNWVEGTWNDDKTWAMILVGGPDAPGSGYVILKLGQHPIRMRVQGLPEWIIRNTQDIIEVRA